MSAEIPFRRRVTTATRWPVGVLLTSWRYLWRTTPVHRREIDGCVADDSGPPLPAALGFDEPQPAADGVGPLYHRIYTAQIGHTGMTAQNLMAHLQGNPDAAAPSEFATFVKTSGQRGQMSVGDEYLVHMAGPWDGPVRVIARDANSFRLLTLSGHLEAGQIQFTAADRREGIELQIESWARSANHLVDLLYTHMRMAKEMQLHMWTSFLERSADLTGGRLIGGIDIETRCVREEDHVRAA